MAKRIFSSSINWAYLAENTPIESKNVFLAFKSKADKYLKLVASNPAELPKIDWNYYKSNIAIPGLVDSFQKDYESMKIPYPTDQGYLEALKTEEANKLKTVKEYNAKLEEKAKVWGEKLKEAESAKKYSQMTIEEFFLACPDQAIDPDNPKLWPQNQPDDSYNPN